MRTRHHSPLLNRAAAGLALVAVVLVPGCTDSDEGGGHEPATTPTVVIKGIAFNPAEITVDAGETVTWRFDDGSTEHIVKGATFESERMSSGVFVQTFNQPGTSTYQCTIFPSMQGRVVVR